MTERILIADASEEGRGAVRAALEDEGFRVTEASDAGDALDRLRARRHRVALVEAELPGDGLALLDSLKTDPDLATTAVVLLTPDPADDGVLAALERGALDCLRKPVDPVEAVVRTRAALRVADLQHRLLEGDERLTELAATDDLTGLLSRRFLESHLRGLTAAAARHGRPLSVVMLDIDNFKEINDEQGHAVGDFVLRTVVKRMKSRLREEDLVGRWGGDEFIVVLPDVDLNGAVSAAEGVRSAIVQTEMTVDGEPIPVSISAGAASWDDESEHDLIHRADEALYEAKAAGRNKVQGARVAGRA